MSQRSLILYHTHNPQPSAKYVRFPGELGFIRAEEYIGPVDEAEDAALPLRGETIFGVREI
jgi:hypothetical protein